MNAFLKLLPESTKEHTAKRAIDALTAQGVDRSKITYDPEEFQHLYPGVRFRLST